jgi:hypothetical protein
MTMQKRNDGAAGGGEGSSLDEAGTASSAISSAVEDAMGQQREEDQAQWATGPEAILGEAYVKISFEQLVQEMTRLRQEVTELRHRCEALERTTS